MRKRNKERKIKRKEKLEENECKLLHDGYRDKYVHILIFFFFFNKINSICKFSGGKYLSGCFF